MAVVGVYLHDPDFASRHAGTGGIVGMGAFVVGTLIGAGLGATLGYIIVSRKSKATTGRSDENM